MRTIIFYILLLLSFLAKAQSNPLFKIISCSEGVTLDGVEVKPGLIVYDNSIKLEIPKKGYTGVITRDGYAYELLLDIEVRKVGKEIKEINKPKSRIIKTGTVHYPPRVLGVHGETNSPILSDSLFLAIFDLEKIGAPYRMIFTNLLDDLLLDDTLKTNWKTYNVKTISKGEEMILLDIVSLNRKVSQNRYLIKLGNSSTNERIRTDLLLIPPNDLIAFAALYEINNLFYDHLFQLYKVETTKNLDLDPISAAYIAKRREKYQLDQYNLK